jgi:Xaa-Pro aminopeptidase
VITSGWTLMGKFDGEFGRGTQTSRHRRRWQRLMAHFGPICDIGWRSGGLRYKMDFTRRAVFGPPSSRQVDEHNGMLALHFEIIERMKPGVAVREVFEFSQQHLAARPEWRNYSDHPSKLIGHGIGHENEPPSICAFDDTVLEAGIALTPEPKIESVEGPRQS